MPKAAKNASRPQGLGAPIDEGQWSTPGKGGKEGLGRQNTEGGRAAGRQRWPGGGLMPEGVYDATERNGACRAVRASGARAVGYTANVRPRHTTHGPHRTPRNIGHPRETLAGGNCGQHKVFAYLKHGYMPVSPTPTRGGANLLIEA